MTMQNIDDPLLEPGLPAFDRIRPEHAEPAVTRLLEAYRQLIDRAGTLPAGDLVSAEILADDDLARAWSTIGHLQGVADTPEWRTAYARCLEAVTRFFTARAHDRKLYEIYRQTRAESPDSAPAGWARMLEHEVRDFRLGGVDLARDDRDRFATISLRLSELGHRFGNNLLDTTQSWSRHFDDASALAGLPEAELAILADNAAAHATGGYRADLTAPCYQAVVTYADDRRLRETFHHAHATRASEIGPHDPAHDNGPVIREMLALRDEQARLLDYPNHAAMRLTTRMAESVEQVRAFLEDLAARTRPVAEREFAGLAEFAGRHGGPAELQSWDIPYYSEKLRETKLGINQDKLRPWFEIGAVIGGLFDTAQQLFGLHFETDNTVPVWHPDVRFYRVTDHDGKPRAALYLDLYSRSGKHSGAWMDVCRSRLNLGGRRQSPVAYLNCNFAPPGRDRPSLLTHDDVVTLFHEFGHCLHHLLTRVELPPVGGITGVEWDAVELPSQLLEEWAWEAASLDRFARHVHTGETLPREWIEALKADRRFLGAMALARQIEFALIDLTLHTRSDADPVETVRTIHQRVGVTPMPEWNRFIHGFSHLFDGGYAAGYYSYLWAERLARDAFEVFRDAGLLDAGAGRRLEDEILAVGAARPMAESWQAFRGRDARLEPLLEAYGIPA